MYFIKLTCVDGVGNESPHYFNMELCSFFRPCHESNRNEFQNTALRYGEDNWFVKEDVDYIRRELSLKS